MNLMTIIKHNSKINKLNIIIRNHILLKKNLLIIMIMNWNKNSTLKAMQRRIRYHLLYKVYNKSMKNISNMIMKRKNHLNKLRNIVNIDIIRDNTLMRNFNLSNTKILFNLILVHHKKNFINL